MPTPEDSIARRLVPRLLVSLVLGALFAWVVAQGGVPLVPTADHFAEVRWAGVAAYVGILVLTHFCRASRWRFLIAPIKRIPLRDVVLLNWIGFFAIFAFPFRLGELARPVLTKIRHGVPVSAGMGTVAVERVVDGLVTSVCVAWALFALPTRPTDDEIARHLPTYGYLALGLFSGAFVALALFLWKRHWATALVEKVFGLVSPSLGRILAEKAASVAEGVRSLGHPALGSRFLVETVAYWSLNATGMWVLGLAVGIPMGAGHAVAVMGILAIGILLPAGPGLFGNFQLFVATALKLYFVEQVVTSEGAVYIFVMYSVQAVVITLLGVIPLYAMRIPLRALLRLPVTPGEPSQES